jgi:hypothetical protein
MSEAAMTVTIDDDCVHGGGEKQAMSSSTTTAWGAWGVAAWLSAHAGL